MAPILFICAIQLAAMEIFKEFRASNINIPSITTSSNYIRPKHYEANGNPINIFILLFMDDGSLPFESREDAIKGTKLCITIMEKFGLTVHTGNKNKRSKTEALFIPSTITLQRWRHTHLPSIANNTSNPSNQQCDKITKSQKVSPSIDLDSIYDNAKEPETFIVDNKNNHIHFVKEFKYLGTTINYMLDDTLDIKFRISQASKAVGALTPLWKSPAVSIETKIKLYLAIPVNLVLWNCETWSGNTTDLNRIDIFHHKTIRRILGINMTDVEKQHITNEKLRGMFGNIDPLSTIWRKRVLKFIGRSICQHSTALAR